MYIAILQYTILSWKAYDLLSSVVVVEGRSLEEYINLYPVHEPTFSQLLQGL